MRCPEKAETSVRIGPFPQICAGRMLRVIWLAVRCGCHRAVRICVFRKVHYGIPWRNLSAHPIPSWAGRIELSTVNSGVAGSSPAAYLRV